MGRVEKFRQLRTVRQKYIISVIIFVTLLTVGIGTADYSINNLIGVDEGLGIFSVNNNNSKVELVFMNQKLKFDLEYVNNDLEKLRQLLAGIFGALH